ncbi:hypothetical protein CJ030_MR3G005597 [Morella rubra]|uniref:Ribosomal RNA-processing protein 42 n=1 Tax=Morella rubra TaxID=262757 RepID=A0A6A1UWS6_9ROSI|nr:hypothetical protein CJ030_MR7G015272 [Morella rubra]KAB1220110.1 hypothetical protein CJ030_MR3G005597 [Morella rubra]
MVGLSLGEKHAIQGGIAQDLRSDGRKRLTYRPLFVETGVIPQGRGGDELSTGLSVALQNCLLGGKSRADALGSAIKAALSNTGILRVHVAPGASGNDQPEVDISDEEFLEFDTSDIPAIVTLTKVKKNHDMVRTPDAIVTGALSRTLFYVVVLIAYLVDEDRMTCCTQRSAM